MANKELQREEGEWLNPNGQTIQLCIVEEIDPALDYSVAAIAVIGGLSLCRHHFDLAAKALSLGQPMTKIMMDVLAGDFN